MTKITKDLKNDISWRVSEAKLMARGLLALFWKETNIQPLTDSDHALNLSGNNQLREVPHEVHEQRRHAASENVIKRLTLLRRNIFGHF